MITPAKERMRKSRARQRLGLRPVQVLVSEQDIDFLLARHYELTRTNDHSIGRAVPTDFALSPKALLHRVQGCHADAACSPAPSCSPFVPKRDPFFGEVNPRHVDIG
jgi:hypothetical protein